MPTGALAGKPLGCSRRFKGGVLSHHTPCTALAQPSCPHDWSPLTAQISLACLVTPCLIYAPCLWWPLQCDVDMHAPLPRMPLCISCQLGYAPVQGSPRCFAGFYGRVLVTEGQGVHTINGTIPIYVPSDGLERIFGPDAMPAAPAGFSFVWGDNTFDGVDRLGSPEPGEQPAWPVGCGGLRVVMIAYMRKKSVLAWRRLVAHTKLVHELPSVVCGGQAEVL